uniref:Selenoprotein n n=1 Tax=Amblyomma maculatum TaxID=34609 RepID=A0A023HQK8_AMBMU|nr:hypothetical protein [Amblyomma maculatum]
MTTSWQFGPAVVIGSALLAFAAVIFSLSCLSNEHQNYGLQDCYIFLDRFITPDVNYLYASVGSLFASVASFGRDSRRLESRNVTIRSFFRGIDVRSLSKNVAEELLSDPESNLQSLLSWNEPHQGTKILPLSMFSTFLPPQSNNYGDPWWLLEGKGLPHSDGHVDGSIYTPPIYNTSAEALLGELFGMFHQNVFLITRASPAGTAAVVARSANGTLDIVFRSHIEFQISSPPQRPLWFTPAQFRGRVVIREDGSILHHFEAYVPADRQLNVDLEWLVQQHKGNTQNTEVDIGKVTEMCLSLDTVDGCSLSKQWASEGIAVEAFRKLDQMFFPFLQVPYYNLSAVVREAWSRQKLVHSIITWGPLDDQSC